ncbi:MAG TPA: VWA domain-containing protein [Flavisolibacter sp.]|jgi:Ca-activated chloride channel family protein|nr:VWA domain-containing protein [Flavisolibacter sp.]
MLYEWIQHIEFVNYWVLPFLLMLPVLAWIHFRSAGKKSTFTVTTVNAFQARSSRNWTFHLPFWLRLLAIGCVIVALARPQTRNVQSRNKGEGIDIILCMDVSGSMLSKDFLPNRLTVAKNMAAEFVKGRPVDQIGLVIFSGESFTQFPLSTDHAGLLEQINGISSGMLEDGTVIGEGLATSVDRLNSSKARTKIIILLTDGNEQPPDTRLIDPITSLEIAKAKGVKVYTIGMGALGGATVEEKGVARSQSSAFLDETLLRRIANQTGGAYFRATDEESLQGIYRQIDRLEKSEVEVVTKERFEEQFVWFMLAALFFLALEFILKYTVYRTFP